MERYLDPKADLTFNKVFGEHPDLARSFLNALLPLEAGEEIESIEYLPAELVPENPVRRFSIVDVRCRDNRGRQFLVEMQMVWSPEFEQRVSFDADKAYVRQLGKGGDYRLPEPVYSLNLLVNNVIDPALPGYYHSYRMVHEACSERVIEGLRLVFVELPKFTPHTFSEKRMHVLWLRYLTEIGDQTVSVSSDLRNDPEVGKALSEIRASAFTDAELAAYDKFWDQVSVEVTLYNSGERKGRAEGRAEGERQKALEIARKLKGVGQTNAEIASLTGLSQEEVERL